MKNQTITKKINFAVLAGIVIALSVTACSDDEDKTDKTKSEDTSVSHSLLKATLSDAEKFKFEKEFAAQCITRELNNSTNKEADEQRITRSCNCIATFLTKDLTAIEAEKFLAEHENAQSLRIKYENAAYHCLQEKVPPQEPDFSRPE
ncbi:MAG: hypothetical protein ACXWTS_08200 [Methylococcaceae bacterium]